MSTLLLLSLAPPANAFAPSDEVHIGIEPVRTHQVNIERQLRFEQRITGGALRHRFLIDENIADHDVKGLVRGLPGPSEKRKYFRTLGRPIRSDLAVSPDSEQEQAARPNRGDGADRVGREAGG